MMVLLKNVCSFSDGHTHLWWGHSNPTSSLQIFALSGSRHAKPSRAGPHAQALELVTRHLVKIALLNISISFNRYNVFEDIRFKLKAQEKKLLITIAFLKLKPSCPFLYHDVAEN